MDGRAEDMAMFSFFSHNLRICGTNPATGNAYGIGDAMRMWGYGGYGEIIAYNSGYSFDPFTYRYGCAITDTAQTACTGWHHDSAAQCDRRGQGLHVQPGHRNIILSSHFDRFACGAWEGPTGSRYYACLYANGPRSGAAATRPRHRRPARRRPRRRPPRRLRHRRRRARPPPRRLSRRARPPSRRASEPDTGAAQRPSSHRRPHPTSRPRSARTRTARVAGWSFDATMRDPGLVVAARVVLDGRVVRRWTDLSHATVRSDLFATDVVDEPRLHTLKWVARDSAGDVGARAASGSGIGAGRPTSLVQDHVVLAAFAGPRWRGDPSIDVGSSRPHHGRRSAALREPGWPDDRRIVERRDQTDDRHASRTDPRIPSPADASSPDAGAPSRLGGGSTSRPTRDRHHASRRSSWPSCWSPPGRSPPSAAGPGPSRRPFRRIGCRPRRSSPITWPRHMTVSRSRRVLGRPTARRGAPRLPPGRTSRTSRVRRSR